jgi:hypothetical protein
MALVLVASVGCGFDNQTPTGTAGSGGGAGSQGGAGSGGGAGAGAGQDGGAGTGVAGSGSDGGNPDAMVETDPTKWTLLSQTGLYAGLGGDLTKQPLAKGVYEYQPQYALWSDGAEKKRWVYLPPGTKINTDDMDFWEYPEGFKLWKEFRRDGKLIETRLLVKKGQGLNDYHYVASKWKEDHSDAVALPMGEANSMGTQHDIPSQEACSSCHGSGSMWDSVLGFSAIQLAHNLGGLNLTMINQMGWLTTAPPANLQLPGDQADRDALGYLHSNCGMCHNERGKAYTSKIDLDLWTHVKQIGTVQTTRAYLSTVCDVWPAGDDPQALHDKYDPITTCPTGHATGVEPEGTASMIAGSRRIVPKMPAKSVIHELMNLRSTGMDMRQMPPLATKIVDPTGLGKVDAWINKL